jgi:hypothetical protein
MTMQTISLFGISVLLMSFGTTLVYGHTTVDVEKYEIQVGWETEPPIVGIRNDLVLKIREHGETKGMFTGITSAFKNLDAKIMYGGLTKKIDIRSDPRAGYYFSPIIPTKTGTYSIDLKGKIGESQINVQIPVEDIESAAVLDFPLSAPSSNDDVQIMQNSVKSLQEEIDKIKSNSEGSSESDSNGNASFGFTVIAIALSSSAIIIGIISRLK